MPQSDETIYRNLDGIAKSLVEPSKDKFIPLDVRYADGRGERFWVYPYPLCHGSYPLTNLSLPEQLILFNEKTNRFQGLSERFGLKLVHGPLKAQFAAYKKPEAKEYVERVLNVLDVFTGELAVLTSDGLVEIRRARNASLKPEDEKIAFVDYEFSEPLQTGIAFTDGLLSINRPPAGSADDFDVVPLHKDLKEDGKLNWMCLWRELRGGELASEPYINWSAVGCFSYPGVDKLFARGDMRTYRRNPRGGIALWTDENPKR